jgi:Transposase IS200 like
MPQSLARVLLHLIFSTKNRESCFADPANRRDLHAYLAATANHIGCPAICVGGVADHVHVVCSLGRTLSVATLVRQAKGQLQPGGVGKTVAVFLAKRLRGVLGGRIDTRGGCPVRLQSRGASQNGYVPRRIPGVSKTA